MNIVIYQRKNNMQVTDTTNSLYFKNRNLTTSGIRFKVCHYLTIEMKGGKWGLQNSLGSPLHASMYIPTRATFPKNLTGRVGMEWMQYLKWIITLSLIQAYVIVCNKKFCPPNLPGDRLRHMELIKEGETRISRLTVCYTTPLILIMSLLMLQ